MAGRAALGHALISATIQTAPPRVNTSPVEWIAHALRFPDLVAADYT
jgi:hypothetical protein